MARLSPATTSLSVRVRPAPGAEPGTIQHAFLVLGEEGLLVVRHGRTAQIAGGPLDSYIVIIY
jgi:hypothetical protein